LNSSPIRVMAGQNMDQFEAYFRLADMDQDGRISGAEAVGFFKGANLPQQVLAQIWTYADHNRTSFLGRAEFYNALKLVTVAQRKRELTPEIVKAALYSPASTQIPPPHINVAVIAPSQLNFRPQFSAPGPTSQGVRDPQGGFPPQQSNQFVRLPQPRPLPPTSTSYNSQPGLEFGFGSTQLGPQPRPQSNVKLTQVAGQPRPQSAAGLTQPATPKPHVSTQSISGNGLAADSMFGDVFSATPSQVKQGSAVPAASAVAPATSPVVPASTPQPNSMLSGLPVSSAIVPVSAGPQHTVASTYAQQPAVNSVYQHQPNQHTAVYLVNQNQPNQHTAVKPVDQHQPSQHTAVNSFRQHQPNQRTEVNSVNQHQPSQHLASQGHVPAQSLTGFSSGPGNSAPQSQQPWPKMTPSSVQKYNKVFVEVDTDRDGKITGEQARNLFLSWRLPREILKQVWDLSDQDNDSMLSLKEFCVALYLMERFREGRLLPSVLPAGIMLDDNQIPPPHQFSAPPQKNPAWPPNSVPGARTAPHPSSARPPRPVPVPIPQEEEVVPARQQKPKVPVLEKHTVDQLSTEEQNSLNLKLQEATEADKKVDELEKEIIDSRKKIEFYRNKMQELILYKSRCDNRLNEIIERVSADKREVELLAKKYEEKYKQSGDVASKLTIEEATFRDIQEKKMELYRAIVKLEEGGSNLETIQGRADRIQLDLEEQIKALNELCKVYGLRGKPTTLFELPFGWQPGIQEGAADLDEDWDIFEDEGFSFVKEFTLDVQNVIAPPITKSSLIRDKPLTVAVENNDEKNKKKKGDTDNSPKSKGGALQTPPESPSSEKTTESPTNSPVRKYTFDSPFDNPSRKVAVDSPFNSPTVQNLVESPTNKFDDSPSKKYNGDRSPHAFDTQSEQGVGEYKGYDDAGWGTFDSHYDSDSAWDFNRKEASHKIHNESSFFGDDDWGLNPIKTGSTYADATNQNKTSSFPFQDFVPGTPAYSSIGSPRNNIFQNNSAPFGFADSVPSTPLYNSGSSPFASNLFQNKSSFGSGFPDSVPSTPMYNEATESNNSFDTFSRFDSFSLNDGGTGGGNLFSGRDASFSRFDSMQSTRDLEPDHGFYPLSDSSSSFARFDSMRSTHDTDSGPALSRFDSMRSTSDFGHGSLSFDDTDPFGSTDLFKSSLSGIDGQTSRIDSDTWRAF
jgi:hypothetical protein